MQTDPDAAESRSTLLPPPERKIRGGQPLDLATKATAAALAQVGEVLLTVLSPRPWYQRILEYEVGGDRDEEPGDG
ncbi:hypothetical protein [Gandjariella thermophila]|uniref:Uncharacterized protein n=1 Tax=Gandjariella thermophila TaxID=1931992 RepID=A0A4D4IZQ8_9PSEU|nr:hypothetical protein [Gandjariella thermophila]GDY28390.1 hypothetical protein GTS_00230 [Gandjariella thermophila]